MQIHTTETPAKSVGEHISQSIIKHDRDVVCLLSGGSVLDVVEFINIEEKNECRTIFMMGDERVSREDDINNYLQLVTRYGDKPAVTDNLISTLPLASESSETFAERTLKTFLQKLSELNNPKIISILGVGKDGHTAGIFPLDQQFFADIYPDDLTYVSVPIEGLRIDSRASFTPSWLLNKADEVIGYVVGQGKQNILNSLIKEAKPINERPAEIIKLHQNAHLYTNLLIE
ncbi:6-phosphogluconolactonase [Candidatus Saccharibacteria bacterium]|nr:6-phosphogluconolactonase [Candidatus Saccharibacteria bacterium]MCB9813995.1 6-phosphogluconolactonase [Candidatus Nomurabacteria bacterium]